MGEEDGGHMKNFVRHAYILFPVAMVLKDIVATMDVLSNEPGISADNARHYHLALSPVACSSAGRVGLGPSTFLCAFASGCFGQINSEVTLAPRGANPGTRLRQPTTEHV